MKSQRGSVTVIAVVMLLFLMTVAIAWLPMMTMEKTAASSDYREQQAWYAAEAGYKRAVAALENKNKDWTWITQEKSIQSSDSTSFGHLSLDGNKVDQEKIWYAVGIMKDGLDISSTYKPEDNVAYQITSVGSCQGIRKVIRKVYTLGDNGETGGGEEPEPEPEPLPPPQENVYLTDALVASSGAVTIYYVNGNNSGKVYVGGAIYAPGFNNAGKVPNNRVKYYVKDEVFSSSYYKDIQNNIKQDLTDGSLLIKGNYYYRNADISNNISVDGSSVLLTSAKINLNNTTIEIPENCNLQIVANGNIDITNVKVTGMGQLTIISKGSITIKSLTGDSKILIIGNGVNFNDPDVTNCFISSKGGIAMAVADKTKKLEYRGQMQAAGSIAVYGNQSRPNLFKLHFVKIGEELIFPPMK